MSQSQDAVTPFDLILKRQRPLPVNAQKEFQSQEGEKKKSVEGKIMENNQGTATWVVQRIFSHQEKHGLLEKKGSTNPTWPGSWVSQTCVCACGDE